jgi:FlaA1/EpsC-like NDP-sugar epimerase
VFVIDAMALFLLIVGSRLSFRIVGDLASRYERRSKQVLIYGAGDGGATLVRELRNNRSYDYQSVGFIDDDPLKLRTRILGVPVLGGLDDLRQLIAERDIDALIVSTDKVDPGRLARLEHICFEAGTTLLRLRFGLEPVRSIKSSPQ